MTVAPDYATPFEGWRVWRVLDVAGRSRLGSVVYDAVWPAGRALVAECFRYRHHWVPLRRRRHEAPESSCQCGIYAARLDQAGEYLADPFGWRPCARVLGRVSLWGEADGDLRGGWDQLVTELGDYGVAVEFLPATYSEAVTALRRLIAA